MANALKTIRKLAGETSIDAALILGSGLSDIGDMLSDKVTIPFDALKGFPSGGVSGHGKDLLIGEMGGKRLAILTGRSFYLDVALVYAVLGFVGMVLIARFIERRGDLD